MMHPDQLTVTTGVVTALVAEQFPGRAGLPVREVRSQGTDNALFRLGDRLAARFPLRPDDPARTLRWPGSEAEAARTLAGSTRFPAPEPVALRRPGAGYPLPWPVQTWEPVTGPVQPGDIEIRFRQKSPLDVGELDVVIEVRTKLLGSRVPDRQRRADLIRDRVSHLPLGQVGVWLILAEGAWSQN